MSDPRHSLSAWAERFYPGQKLFGFSQVDGTIPFLLRIHSLLTPQSIVLDFGAGRGAQYEQARGIKRELLEFRKRGAKVIGIDVSDEIDINPLLDEKLQFTEDYKIPLETRSVDLVMADWVCEHLPVPEQSLAEIHRVLKTDGWFAFRTPNKWHYSMLASRIIPERKHAGILKHIQQSRKEKDVFPKYYRMNTLASCRRVLNRTGFNPLYLCTHEPEPVYLAFSKFSYAAGVLYQKFASFLPLPSLRLIIIAFAQKSL